MSERVEAIQLAHRIMEEPNCDPDDDIRVLARQLVRCTERADRLVSNHRADLRSVASAIRDVASRIGVAASPGWVRGELEGLANKYEVWSRGGKTHEVL